MKGSRPPARSPVCEMGDHERCQDGAAIRCRCTCHSEHGSPARRSTPPTERRGSTSPEHHAPEATGP